MPVVSKQALVPHTAEQMYQLINQVEHYPLFLPWCQATEILSQSAQEMKAKVKIAKGPVTKSFITHNTMQPNQEVTMKLVEGPFKRLFGTWRIDDHEQGCEISFYLEFEFSSPLLSLTFGPIFNQATQTMMSSFLQRANELYGQ